MVNLQFDRQVAGSGRAAHRDNLRQVFKDNSLAYFVSVLEAVLVNHLQEIGKELPRAWLLIPRSCHLLEEHHLISGDDQILQLTDWVDVGLFPFARTEFIDLVSFAAVGGRIVQNCQLAPRVQLRWKDAAGHGAFVVDPAMSLPPRSFGGGGDLGQKLATSGPCKMLAVAMDQADDVRCGRIVFEMEMRRMFARDNPIGIGPAASEIPEAETFAIHDRQDISTSNRNRK